MNADYKYLSKISVKIEPRIRISYVGTSIYTNKITKHLRVYSHFCNYYRLVPKSTYYKYVVYVTNDHTLEERIL